MTVFAWRAAFEPRINQVLKSRVDKKSKKKPPEISWGGFLKRF